MQKLFHIYRKFTYKKKLIYFLKFRQITLNKKYQKKYDLSIKHENVHNRLFNDSKVKQQMLNELKRKYSQNEELLYTFTPIINNNITFNYTNLQNTNHENIKSKTPTNKYKYNNSCVISPSLGKCYGVNNKASNKNLIYPELIQNMAYKTIENKTCNNFYRIKNINNCDFNVKNSSINSDIALKKFGQNELSSKILCIPNYNNENQYINFSSTNYNFNKKLSNNNSHSRLNGAGFLNNNNNERINNLNSNHIFNHQKTYSLEKYNTPSSYTIPHFRERNKKNNNKLLLKKSNSISLRSNNVTSEQKSGNEINNNIIHEHKSKNLKKEYYYTFRKGQIPLNSFNTVNYIPITSNGNTISNTNNFSNKNKLSNKCFIDKVLVQNKNKRNSLNNIYLNNYNNKMFKLNNSNSNKFYSINPINSIENTSNTLANTNLTKRNKNSHEKNLSSNFNNDTKDTKDTKGCSEYSFSNKSQRESTKIQNNSLHRIPFSKRNGLSFRNSNNNDFNFNIEKSMTLQSINDSKFMEMANYYVANDECLEDFEAKKVIFDKKNKKLSVVNNKMYEKGDNKEKNGRDITFGEDI